MIAAKLSLSDFIALEESHDTSLQVLCEEVVEDLLLEHLTGRHEGFLRAAADFLQCYRDTHGQCPDEEIAAAAAEEGFSEEEIAAVLLWEYQRQGGESADVAPLWADEAERNGI